VHFHVTAQISHYGTRLIRPYPEPFLFGCAQRPEEFVGYEFGAHPRSMVFYTHANVPILSVRPKVHVGFRSAGLHCISHDMFECSFELVSAC
jgi:hypothetical protein